MSENSIPVTVEQSTEAAPVASEVESRPTYTPEADVIEFEDRIEVRIDLPGVAKDDLEVDLERDELRVRGRDRRAVRREGFLHQEYGVGDAFRSFRVSRELDTASVEAVLEDGVLSITLPKRPEARTQRIEVRTA